MPDRRCWKIIISISIFTVFILNELAARQALGTILTFETTRSPAASEANWDKYYSSSPLNAYGDNVNFGSSATGSSLLVNGGTTWTLNYNKGNGWTPNVTVDYLMGSPNLNDGIGRVNDPTNPWGSGVAWLDSDNNYSNTNANAKFYFVFTPQPGYQVRVNSYDLRNYSFDGHSTQTTLYKNSINGPAMLPTYTDNNVGSGPGVTQHYDLANNGSAFYSGPVALEVKHVNGTNWTLALDNLNFDQRPVPVPKLKKLIKFGIDSPDTVWMQNNTINMELAPFDGTVFYLTTDAARSQGIVGDFSWGGFGTTQYTKSQIQTGINALKNTNFNKFTDNFLRVTTTASTNLADKSFVDWFDSFHSITSNMGLAANAAKEGGAKGIFFDIEPYAGPLWDYAKQRDAGTKTFEQYAAQVRVRGAEVMQAFQSAYPGITIMLAEGYTLPYRDEWPWPYTPGPGHYSAGSNDPNKLKKVASGLLAAFLDGMVDAAAPTTKLIDGSEGTYTHHTAADFAEYRARFTDGVLPLVGVSDQKYRDTFTQAFATWLDVNWRIPGGWNGTDFINNFWQPGEIEEALVNSLNQSDEYSWLYSESQYFWGPSKNVPAAYWNAIADAYESIPFATPGDADLDGDVDLSDLSTLAGSYGATSGKVWKNGDFDQDGDVDLSDLSSLASNYGQGEAVAMADWQAVIATVPEPAGIVFSISTILVLNTRRNIKPSISRHN